MAKLMVKCKKTKAKFTYLDSVIMACKVGDTIDKDSPSADIMSMLNNMSGGLMDKYENRVIIICADVKTGEITTKFAEDVTVVDL